MITKTTRKTKVIQTRLDAELVDKASEILDYIGLSTTDAVRMLFKNIVNTGTIPAVLLSSKPYFDKEQSQIVDID